MALEKQMELFEDGGLKDEGGTTDPVSGNDVPPGSTQEEVRDDIPAQLSEGEFVFPADVVRYIGLEKLMQMRQEAKLGLKMMEDMGQMGNSDEAVMPDDIPFDLSDLDMEDDKEYNVGGFVPATPDQQQFGIAGYQQAAAPTTGFTQIAQPVQAASSQVQQAYTPVAQAAVPTMRQYEPAEIPTFSDFTLGEFGSYDELREYRNEAGNVIMIPFKDGQPISPIPEGYTYVDPEAIATEEVTTTSTTPQSTTVRPEDDNEPPQSAAEIAEMRARVNAAKKMGITEQVGFSMAGALGRYGPDDVGKFTPTGYIIGKGGVLLDPLTGMTREQSSPNMIAGILNAIAGGQEPSEPAYSDEFFDAMPDQAKDVLGRSLGKEARDTRIAEAEKLRKETEARIAKAAEEARQKALEEERNAALAEAAAKAAEARERQRIRRKSSGDCSRETENCSSSSGG